MPFDLRWNLKHNRIVHTIRPVLCLVHNFLQIKQYSLDSISCIPTRFKGFIHHNTIKIHFLKLCHRDVLTVSVAYLRNHENSLLFYPVYYKIQYVRMNVAVVIMQKKKQPNKHKERT